MSPTSEPDNPLNVISLKDHFDSRFNEHEKMHSQLAENVRVALTAMEKRLDGMNEFREAIEDVVGESITRTDYERRHDDLTKAMNTQAKDTQRQLDDLKRRFAILTGAGLVLVPLAGLIGAAIAKAFHI